jgi:2-methylisocitrate lyase-like PEP mutase family enzyme
MKYLKKLITKHISIDEEEWNELTSKFKQEVVKSTILPVNIMTMPDLLSFDILQQTGIKRISQGPFIYNSLMENFENKLKTINKDNSFKSLF